jgi:hypothetical protein
LAPIIIDILTEVAEAGLDAVEAACAEALAAGLFGRDVVLDILARRRDADPPPAVATPTALALAIVGELGAPQFPENALNRMLGTQPRGNHLVPRVGLRPPEDRLRRRACRRARAGPSAR